MEQSLKQILYRSTHRGCKETDFLIGEFVKAKLAEIYDLKIFSDFLQEDDWNIYDWLLNKQQEPAQYKKIVGEIRAFHKIDKTNS
jgi:antitoxin CptB